MLLLGDAHATPIASNERFDWLGQLIADELPDLIMCTGDFADMPSLSSYDKGKKSAELKRYSADIECTRDALERIELPVRTLNINRRKNKKLKYSPRKIILGGNHDEGRISKAVELSPELDGTLAVKDIGYEQFGWEYISYRDSVCIEDIYCSHSFPSGVMGQPISGLTIASALLAKNSVSSIVGHCHLFDYAVRSKPNGDKLMALSPGCYLEHTEEYAKHTQHMWWSGVCLLTDVEAGSYDLQTISMKKIRERYAV